MHLHALSLLASSVLAVYFFAPPASAAPFKYTPTSFQSYLNTLKWRGGKAVIFANIGSCKVREPIPDQKNPDGTAVNPYLQMLRPSNTEYSCSEGYVTEISPLGKRVCELSPFGAHISAGGGVSWVKGGGVSYNVIKDSCRWK
jgi:hypothetical protein